MLIDNIAEASKNTRKIYQLYLGFLSYCALTVISTTDRTLVLNESAHLPIVNVGVPLEGFFIFAPILAIMIFIYFQFYLQNLKDMKSELEDNYAAVNKNRIYPWIVNILDFPQHGIVGFLQKFVVKFALWWSLPSVLIIFALYYVKKHDLVMSYYLGLLLLVGTLLVVAFRLKYEETRYFDYIKKRKIGFGVLIILIFAESFFLTRIIPWSMEGGKHDFLKPWLCVDLSYQKLITEPDTDYEGLYWADFSGVHLEGANLTSAVLKRADLSYAHLEKAILNNTNLIKADLSYSSLCEAIGRGAVLDSVDLYGADLTDAEFRVAFLQEAILDSANFTEADLDSANLQGSNIKYAILHGAHLKYANLSEVNLFFADLRGANLNYARLGGTVLACANLQDAKFALADFQNALFLELEQLSQVKTLYEAQLDSSLLEQIKAQYPHLLEPPEDEVFNSLQGENEILPSRQEEDQ